MEKVITKVINYFQKSAVPNILGKLSTRRTIKCFVCHSAIPYLEKLRERDGDKVPRSFQRDLNL